VVTYTAVGQINKIESVQRWFTERIKSLSNRTYDERLIKLGNDRLELRRQWADLLMCYKIIILLIYTKKIFSLWVASSKYEAIRINLYQILEYMLAPITFLLE